MRSERNVGGGLTQFQQKIRGVWKVVEDNARGEEKGREKEIH